MLFICILYTQEGVETCNVSIALKSFPNIFPTAAWPGPRGYNFNFSHQHKTEQADKIQQPAE